MTKIAIAQIIVVMSLWAICFPLVSSGIAFSPHLTFAAMRAILAGFILTALAIILHRPLPKNTREWVMLAIIGVCATSFGFLGMFHAAEFVSPGIATVIANTQPLLAAVFATFLLNERLTKWGRVGIALGFTGIVVLASPQLLLEGQSNYAVGIAYIMLAAIGITISNVLIKRIAGAVDSLLAMGIQLLIGSIPLILAAGLLEEPATIQWTPKFVVILLVLSVLGTAAVYWLWISILEKTPLNQANAFSFLIPIFGLSMGVLFYGEAIGWVQLLGIALTVLGVGLVTRQ